MTVKPESVHKTQSSPELDKYWERRKLGEIKGLLESLNINSHTDISGLYHMTIGAIKRVDAYRFKNEHLDQYKADVLNRAKKLMLSSGDLEEIKQMSTADFAFIRENEEKCLKWAYIASELWGLWQLYYGFETLGLEVDNKGLLPRLIEIDETQDENERI
ncbi:MAG: hypothetical protein HOP23_16590 [Methylococcaceae bacterium]|nr:hypothetical protein [Methylococcaceae bacterium]